VLKQYKKYMSHKTIQEVYEPYLIASKLILPTPRGRIVTEKAINHIKEVTKDV